MNLDAQLIEPVFVLTIHVVSPLIIMSYGNSSLQGPSTRHA
jgi:hypothetical protein